MRTAQVGATQLRTVHGLEPAWRVILRYMTSLDATDAKLLLQLQANPRATGVELAARLGLSRNTVQARLAKWDEDDVLAPFDRRVDPRNLGYPLSALVAIVCDQHQLDPVVDALAEIAEVVEVHGISGLTDLSVKVVGRDADDLYRIAGQILRIPGVERTNMALIMRELVGLRMAPLLRRLAEQGR